MNRHFFRLVFFFHLFEKGQKKRFHFFFVWKIISCRNRILMYQTIFIHQFNRKVSSSRSSRIHKNRLRFPSKLPKNKNEKKRKNNFFYLFRSCYCSYDTTCIRISKEMAKWQKKEEVKPPNDVQTKSQKRASFYNGVSKNENGHFYCI